MESWMPHRIKSIEIVEKRERFMQFSIIIPCYNEADNIEDLIRKIMLLQDKYDLEYILVENGSKDGSRQYFTNYVEGKYKNIKVVYVDENKGYGYGIQEGIKLAAGEYVGWIHADLQVPPEVLCDFFEEVKKNCDSAKPLFLKGRRTNRSIFDRFFTNGQSFFNTCLFKVKLYDIGAIPVLVHRSLIESIDIESMPNDFSIELYIYKEAIIREYVIKRIKIKLMEREKGNSSWNHGLKSKIRQSKVIFHDSLKIKRGEKVY